MELLQRNTRRDAQQTLALGQVLPRIGIVEEHHHSVLLIDVAKAKARHAARTRKSIARLVGVGVLRGSAADKILLTHDWLARRALLPPRVASSVERPPGSTPP